MKIVNLVKGFVYGLLFVALLTIGLGVVLSRIDTPSKMRVFTVQSGSMEPAIKTGSLVFTLPKDEYKKGDIVTYRRGGDTTTVTHRIISESTDPDIGITTYITQGDANDAPDVQPVFKQNIVGRVVLNVPFIGYPIAFAQTQLGFMLMVVVPATLIIYTELMSIKSEALKLYANRKARKTEKSKTKAELVPKFEPNMEPDQTIGKVAIKSAEPFEEVGASWIVDDGMTLVQDAKIKETKKATVIRKKFIVKEKTKTTNKKNTDAKKK